MKRKKVIILVLLFILVLGISYVVYLNYVTAPYITSIEKNDDKRFQDRIIVNVHVENYFYKLNKDTWCFITNKDGDIPEIDHDDWKLAVNGYCNFSVPVGDYDIYVKDSYGNINSIETQKVKIDKVVQIKPEKNTYYLYKGQKDKIDYSLVSLGDADESISYSVNNKNVSVDSDGNINGLEYGNSTVTLETNEGIKASVRVYVSPLITKPKVNTGKPYIKCQQFTAEDAQLIDNMLFDRIDEAGYKTRAGVVAAARFITLEFSYRVHYFYENGRLNNYKPYLHVDGEGRYYHRGMYLHTSKFSSLDQTGIFVGPAIWGCDLQNYTNWGPYVAGKNYPNGLDCSGFVSWALLNGGFNVGDIGAGENANHNDLDDLGKKVTITNELMKSGRVKPGDLIGLNGHMAILCGWDANNYYIAESLNTTGGVVMTVVPKNKLVGKSMYKYIILMDSVYKEDGNLTNMW